MNRYMSWAGMAVFGSLPIGPAMAGEQILYDAAPGWVEAKSVTAADSTSSPLVLMDQQVRLEGGTVSEYSDLALRLSSPEMLTNAGTLTARWMPDKGDLVIHRVELIRDGETIDVLATGARFETLQREKQLEQRIVDGARTATLAVPGARLGDIVRLSYTVTSRDQALGDEMQWVGMLPPEPMPIGRGSATVSWPAGAPLRWQARRAGAVGRWGTPPSEAATTSSMSICPSPSRRTCRATLPCGTCNRRCSR